MLTSALVPYLYFIPALIVVIGAWAYVYFFWENLLFFVFLGVAVLIVYPLWVWHLGAFPTQLMSLEAAALGAACLTLTAIGAFVGAMTDGTW